MAGKIEIMETVLRDAHQCLVATRMRTEDMLPIAAALDDIGYWSLETWGGATFDATLRYLKESPWERLRKLRAAMPKTRFQMLLRGQNVVGYHNYPDDVVQAFVARAADNGIDVFRIFDAMNDIRNMKTAIEAALKTGKLVEGTVCYTISPVHSADYFLRVAEKLADMGVQIICLKDMAGMLAPYAAYEIIKKIKSRIALPLHLHSHCTAGLAPMSYMMAIEAGVDILDTAIAPFSQGTSQPATEQLVAALKDTPHDTGLDLAKLGKIADYFYRVRRNYAEFESPVNNQIKTDVLTSQIPGGMLSNLVAQLRQQNAEDKLDAVLGRNAAGETRLGLSATGDADQSDRRLAGGIERDDRQTLFGRGDGNAQLRDGALRRAARAGQRRNESEGSRQKGTDHLPAGGSVEAGA